MGRGKAFEQLTEMQKAFVQHYLSNGGNALQAAKSAGYSEKTAGGQGRDLLQIPAIYNAIRLAAKKDECKLEISRERWANELLRIAFSDMGKMAKWGPEGVTFFDSDGLEVDQTAAVQEVMETWGAEGGGSKKLKLHDKLKALEMLGKHFGYIDGKLDTTAKSTVKERLRDTLKCFLGKGRSGAGEGTPEAET